MKNQGASPFQIHLMTRVYEKIQSFIIQMALVWHNKQYLTIKLLKKNLFTSDAQFLIGHFEKGSDPGFFPNFFQVLNFW